MKKIVMGLAAVAMAATMFAVDINSMVQIDGDLLNYDGSDVKAVMLKEYDPSGDSDYLWKLSVTGDNAGAEIWSWNIDGSVSSKKIWFKPVDALKITLGNVGGQSIAHPQFGWWAQSAQNYSYGYQAELALGDLSMKLALEDGTGAYWYDPTATNLFGGKIGGTWFDLQYNLGDAGTIQALATINGTIGAHGYSNWATSPLAVGIAYAKMPYLDTGFYADAIFSFKYDGDDLAFQGVDSQIGGQFKADALLLQLTNLIQYRDEFKYGFEFKGSYKIDAFTPYVQIAGYDIMNKNLTVDLGVSTSVGACTILAYVDLPINLDNYNFTFSVPVQFTINL